MRHVCDTLRWHSRPVAPATSLLTSDVSITWRNHGNCFIMQHAVKRIKQMALLWLDLAALAALAKAMRLWRKSLTTVYGSQGIKYSSFVTLAKRRKNLLKTLPNEFLI